MGSVQFLFRSLEPYNRRMGMKFLLYEKAGVMLKIQEITYRKAGWFIPDREWRQYRYE